MAFSTVRSVNFIVFIFVISCTQRQILSSKDVYQVYGGDVSWQDEVVTVDLEGYKRSKRQATPLGSTTTARPTTTTPFDLGNANLFHDDHLYYVSRTQKNLADKLWVSISANKHDILSDSHRTAVTQDLPFPFPFYGHSINKVTIATGGFLYMSPFIHKFLTATQYIAPLMANFETKSGGTQSRVLFRKIGFLYMSPFIHQWLTATQYIAPLMANFDTTVGNKSDILVDHVDDKFVVEWRDVHLQDQNTTGTFQFQAILHTNGSIFFLYKKLPIPLRDIKNESHRVTVGLADAFHVIGTKRRTIYEYHRVTLNTSFIEEGTVVMVHPKPTCNKFSTCEACVTANIDFECRWCGIIGRCSDSIDWHRQEWINQGCVQLSHEDGETCPTSPTSPSATTSTTSTTTTTTADVPLVICSSVSGASNCSLIATAQPRTEKPSNNSGTVAVAIVVALIVLVLIGTVVGWVYYAYTHPTSASGMWLMEHRPSQMKAKLNNMKFWKRNGAAADKYAVESTA